MRFRPRKALLAMRLLLVFAPAECIMERIGIRMHVRYAQTTGSRRAVNRLGYTMRNHLRISLVFALALLGDAAAAYAQSSGSFNRVTAAGARRLPASSAPRATSVARSDGPGRLEATSFSDDSLRPYSSQSQLRTQGSAPGVPRYSTQQEQPVATRQVAPQSRTYFPGMRAARAIQQPVTLTARSTGLGVRHICVPSRSQMIGGGGSHR
jgi:hypothetical protein